MTFDWIYFGRSDDGLASFFWLVKWDSCPRDGCGISANRTTPGGREKRPTGRKTIGISAAIGPFRKVREGEQMIRKTGMQEEKKKWKLFASSGDRNVDVFPVRRGGSAKLIGWELSSVRVG